MSATYPGWQVEPEDEYDSDHEYGGMMERIGDDVKTLSELISSASEAGLEFEVEATPELFTVYFVEPEEPYVARDEWCTRMPPDFDLKIDELDELPWPYRLVNPAMALFPRVEELRMPVLWLQRMGSHMTDIAAWPDIKTLILVHVLDDDFRWDIGTNIAFRGVDNVVFAFDYTPSQGALEYMPRFLTKFFATHLAPETGLKLLDEVKFVGIPPDLERAIGLPIVSLGPTVREADDKGMLTITFTDVPISYTSVVNPE